MRVVTQADIKEMNKLYVTLKTYAAVARATGFSPSTVKKYIIQGYQVVEEDNIIRFNKPLPDFDDSKLLTNDWGNLCVLTEEEIDDLPNIWKEIEV